MNSNREDGIINVHCMSTKDYLRFYGEKKYWNLKERDSFMEQTTGLQRGISQSRRDGHLFMIPDQNAEQELLDLRVRSEIDAAVAKHGEAKIPKSYEDAFYQKIKNKKREIATSN